MKELFQITYRTQLQLYRLSARMCQNDRDSKTANLKYSPRQIISISGYAADGYSLGAQTKTIRFDDA